MNFKEKILSIIQKRKKRDYLTVGEIAMLLGVNPQTVRRWIDDGKMKGIKFKWGRRVSIEDFVEFLVSSIFDEELKSSLREAIKRILENDGN